MNKRLFAVLSLVVFFIPSIAFAAGAMETELYTYGGYAAVEQAFKNMALIFSDNSYMALYGMALIMGVVFGGAAIYTRIVSGQNTHPLSYLPSVVIGICVYTIFIVPKSTVHIYDTVFNKDVEIANVPDGIALLAGGLNVIERKAVEIVDTAAGVPVNGKQSGGFGWLGLYNSYNHATSSGKPEMDATLNRYVADCVSFELVRPGTDLTVQELRGTDPANPQTKFITSLAKAANPAIDTLVYSATDAMGAAMSCADAWDLNGVGLKTDLTLKTNFDVMNKKAKLESGFGASGFTSGGGGALGTDPYSSTLLQALAISNANPAGSNISDSNELMRQIYISRSLDTFLRQGNTTAVTNFQFMQNATGSMVSANSWLPYLRAGLMAITIGMVPFIALFIPTPLMGRAVGLICGLFIWNTVWGVADIVIQSFAIQFAEKTFEAVRAGSLGMDGIMFMPTQSVKMLSIFGMLRMSGMALATIITGMLVKFGGSAMAHMAGGISGSMQSTGASGAAMTENPAGNASAIKANVDASPTKAWANNYGFGERTQSSGAAMFSGTASTNSAVSAAGGFSSYVGSNALHGAVEQHKKQGGNAAFQNGRLVGSSMGMSSEDMDKIQADHHNPAAFMTTMQRLQTQSQGMGLNGDQASQMYFDGKKIDSMSSNSIGGNQGFNISRVDTPDGRSVMSVKSGLTVGAMDPSTGNFTNISGLNAGVKTSERQDASFAEKTAESRSQTAQYQQQVGSQIMEAMSNSTTRSSLDALANKSSVVSSGMHAVSKATERAITQSIDNATSITDSDGKTWTKGMEGYSEVAAQAKAGVEMFGTGGGVSVSAGGRLSAGIKTSQGREMKVSFGEKESRAITQKAGEAWSDTTTKSKGIEKSATDSTAVAEAQTITGTRSAQESLTASEQRTNSLERARSASQSSSVDGSTNQDAAFVNFVGNTMFGGGSTGNLKAANYLNELGSSGDPAANQALKGLMSDFVESKALAPSGDGMPKVDGPKGDMVDFAGAKEKIQPAAERLMDKQDHQPHPSGAPQSLRDQIKAFNPNNGVGGFNLEAEKRLFDVNKDNLNTAWGEANKISNSPTAPLEVFLGAEIPGGKTTPSAQDTRRGYVYQNPSLTEGLGDRVGTVLSAVSGRDLGIAMDNQLNKKFTQLGKELSLLSSGNPTVAVQDTPGSMAHIEPYPYPSAGGKSSPGGLSLLGGN